MGCFVAPQELPIMRYQGAPKEQKTPALKITAIFFATFFPTPSIIRGHLRSPWNFFVSYFYKQVAPMEQKTPR